jgi:hypothetical protein
LSKVSVEYAAGNATGSEELAIAAHREYFDHLMTALEQRNATELSEQTEKMLGVELVGLIRNSANSGDIDSKITEIKAKLDQAVVIVPEFPIGSIGILAALIGAVGFIGRHRLFRR